MKNSRDRDGAVRVIIAPSQLHWRFAAKVPRSFLLVPKPRGRGFVPMLSPAILLLDANNLFLSAAMPINFEALLDCADWYSASLIENAEWFQRKTVWSDRRATSRAVWSVDAAGRTIWSSAPLLPSDDAVS